MAPVRLERVGKVYPGGVRAVDDLSLEIGDGELMVLVGPSGCGKTTALRIVAGLESASEGRVTIGDRVVDDLPPRERDVAMVFQSYALYPHLSVRENIAFGLRLRGQPKAEVEARVGEAARALGLSELLDRRPGALSGGQRQRVAMGRAIVRRPQAFLMDEPLSNLDARLRVQMRAEISRLQAELGVTTLYVTHDQVEAMTMGHRVAVMRRGVLQQVASPQEVYDRPVNLFVAGFIGSPAMNLLAGRIEVEGEAVWCALGGERLRLGAGTLAARPAIRAYAGEPVVLGVRPEGLEDAALAGPAPAGARLRGRVELREALGSEVVAHVRVAGAAAASGEEVRELAADAGAADAPVGMEDGGALVVGRLAPRSRATPGEPLELAVDTDSLHCFDPDSGLAIYDERPTPEARVDEGSRAQAALVGAAGGRIGPGDDRAGRGLWRRRRR